MSRTWELFAAYWELTKPRIVILALMMAAMAYFLGSEGPLDWTKFTWMMVGLFLIGASCGALNNYLEQDVDALMERTKDRPIPAGKIPARHVLVAGIVTGLLGEFVLLGGVNSPTAVIGALTLFFYLGVYTPAKRTTALSTLIGAVPGAFPPLMGWTAAYGGLAPQGFLLFGILFLWQIPHFLAIGWMYRADYERAGLPILSVVDEEGIATAKQIVMYSVALLPLSLVPTLWGITGKTYFFGALLMGLVFLGFGIALSLFRTRINARRLLLASVIYLPLLGVLMCWDRI